MTATELALTRRRAAALPPGLGPAAQRFATDQPAQERAHAAHVRVHLWPIASWLADYTKTRDPPRAAFTAHALIAYLDELEQDRAPTTVKKERAALNRLARYLHTLGAIDATEILTVETAHPSDTTPARDALDAAT